MLLRTVPLVLLVLLDPHDLAIREIPQYRANLGALSHPNIEKNTI